MDAAELLVNSKMFADLFNSSQVQNTMAQSPIVASRRNNAIKLLQQPGMNELLGAELGRPDAAQQINESLPMYTQRDLETLIQLMNMSLKNAGKKAK